MGTLSLRDGRQANVVLIGPRENPKGATLVVPGEAGAEARALPLSECLDMLHAESAIDIVCMQERVYGGRDLPSPFERYAQP